mgnify:CR=1 FL=1|jgi:hypothetical protein
MIMDVNWLDIIELYLLICFTYLYFYQKKRMLNMQKQINTLHAQITAAGNLDENP